jgi:hypothetical protein
VTWIETLVEIESPRGPHPAGTSGAIIELLGPDAWLVELRTPDETLVGGASYQTVQLSPDAFRVVPGQSS